MYIFLDGFFRGGELLSSIYALFVSLFHSLKFNLIFKYFFGKKGGGFPYLATDLAITT
jgi:hypothetical protein